MAVTVRRKYEDVRGSETVETGTRTIPFFIDGTDDYDTARSALLAESPGSEAGLVRSSFGELKKIAATTYECDVSYEPYIGGLPDPTAIDIPGQAPREKSFQFNTGGTTFRRLVSIKSSKGVLKVGAAGNAKPSDSGGLINAGPDGIEGVEDEECSFRFTITKAYGRTELSSAQHNAFADASKCINSQAVTLTVDGFQRRFDAGSLYLHSVNAGRGDDGVWRYSFDFEHRPNVTGTIVQGLQPFTKRGWDYLDVRTSQLMTGDGKIPSRKAETAYTHQIKEEYDFNLLGI